jgi:hypothetical protein
MFPCGSLEGALERARREEAEALPGSFAAGVMSRLQVQAPSRTARFTTAAAIAAAIVVTAGAVSFWGGGRQESATPPPLGMFGSPSSHSPFATP